MKKWTVLFAGGLFLSLFGCLNVEFDENGKIRNLSLEPLQPAQPVETTQPVSVPVTVPVEGSSSLATNLTPSAQPQATPTAVSAKAPGLIASVWEIDGNKAMSSITPKSEPLALFVDDADKFSIEAYRKDPATATVSAFHIRESGLIELKNPGKYTFVLSVPNNRDRCYSELSVGGKKSSLKGGEGKACTVSINVGSPGFYNFELCLIRQFRDYHEIAITVREPGVIQSRPVSPSELFHVTE